MNTKEQLDKDITLVVHYLRDRCGLTDQHEGAQAFARIGALAQVGAAALESFISTELTPREPPPADRCGKCGGREITDGMCIQCGAENV